MKMWSRGLGRTELSVEPGLCQIKSDPETGGVVIYGNVREPVNWEFKSTIYPEDTAGILNLVLRWCVIKLILKNLWRYFAYRWKNRRAAGEDNDLEGKVDHAYDQIMRRNRPGLQA